MSKFIDFLKTMDVFVPTVGDVIKSTLFSPTGRQDTTTLAQTQLKEPPNPAKIEDKDRSEPSKWFKDGQALIYPQDLFEITPEGLNEPGRAYILFMIRQPTVQSPTTLKRIGLYMPPSIRVRYGAQWENINMNVLRTSTGAENLVNSAKAAVESGSFASAGFSLDKSLLTDVPDMVLSNAVRGLGSMLDDTSFGSQLGVELRAALNPHASQKFIGIDLREFQFSFQLFARTKNESESIRQIIKMFKWAMHPEGMKAAAGKLEKIYWDYPNPIDIYLFTPSTKYMFNIAQSVLFDMEVTYGEEGASFFKETGAPVQVNLTLSFREMEVLTKQRIEEDY